MFSWKTWSCPVSDALEMSTYDGCFPIFFFFLMQKSDSLQTRSLCAPNGFLTYSSQELLLTPSPPPLSGGWEGCGAGRRRHCLLLGPQSQRDPGRSRSRWLAASAITAWADTPAAGENVWWVTRGQQTSLTLHFCLYSVALLHRHIKKLPLFWEGHAEEADDGFYTLNLSLCPPTDLFTNKVERPKVSVLNPCLQ